MNRELLEKPFEPSLIKKRKGNFDQIITYIEGQEVIKRLNDAFDCQWSFTVISHEVLEAEVVVLGEFVADGIKKMQFGSSSITRAKETGKLISLGDDLKAAATDSLKKCATMLGVGLHLYGENKPKPTESTASRQPADSNNKNSSTNHTSTNQTGRISSKQYNYLISLATSLGMSKQEVDRRAIEEFGAAVSFLNKNDASTLIQQLSQ